MFMKTIIKQIKYNKRKIPDFHFYDDVIMLESI